MGIINLDIITGDGTHWVCYYNDPKYEFIEYFDPFGEYMSDDYELPEEIEKYLKTSNKHIRYSSNFLQKPSSVKCGYYCMKYIIERNKDAMKTIGRRGLQILADEVSDKSRTFIRNKMKDILGRVCSYRRNYETQLVVHYINGLVNFTNDYASSEATNMFFYKDTSDAADRNFLKFEGTHTDAEKMITLINKIKLNENYNEGFADRWELTKNSNLYLDRENTADKNNMVFDHLDLTRCYIRVNDTMFPMLDYGVSFKEGELDYVRYYSDFLSAVGNTSSTESGCLGAPGNGFELTEDGEYDMKNKILRNTKDPIESSDASTKRYVDKLKRKSIQLNGDVFNAQGKRIDNVEDPQEDMNAVNNRYLKQNLLPLSEKINTLEEDSLTLKSDKYDGKGKIISNIEDPIDKKDVVTKAHLDYHCILWENGHYFARNELISGIKDPVGDSDAVNKKYFKNKLGKPLLNGDVAIKGYVDQKNFYAYSTIAIEDSGKVRFNNFNSSLLNDKMELSIDMFMKISVTFVFSDDEMQRKQIKNLADPIESHDAVHKKYIDKKTKINAKRADNLLSRNHDGLYVSLPKTFCATIQEEYHRFSVLNSHVEFNVFTSDLLTSDMIFTTDMLMRITVYLKQEHSYNPRIDVDHLKDNDRDVLYFGRLKDRNPIILIANSKRDYQLQMAIEPIE
ncbi:ULP_PROTEASE domain-containing protein [Trichonephila clavipes]|nr:ULP_PROTEASE domain-containing protein [Trichonephila clavipes]